MIKNLIITRHGQSHFNSGETDMFDSPLTQNGEEQARKFGIYTSDYIKNNLPEVEFVGLTSPYLRCLQTTRIANEYLKLPFHVFHDIGERPLDLHLMRGDHTVIKRKNEFPEFIWGDEEHYCYQETESQYETRLKRSIDFFKDKNLLIVAHRPVTIDLIWLIVNKEVIVKNCSFTFIKDDMPIAIAEET